MLAIFSNCGDHNEFQPMSIEEVSSKIPIEYRRLAQLRLSLAKTTARALANKNFREYIFKKSKEGSDLFFNEIVLEFNKGDMVLQNENLITFLNKYVSNDVKALFGDSLFVYLSIEDPCVVLKIPDIFYNYTWDLNNTIPMVYAGVPSLFLNGGYQAYHHSGYHEEIVDGGLPEHFYLTVKLSEDYRLYDKNHWINTLGISLFEELPQIQYDDCWDKIEDSLIYSGRPSVHYPDLLYIHKFKAFEMWKRLCSYRGPLLMNSGCTQPKLRDCVPFGESNLVLKSIKIQNSILTIILSPNFTDCFNFYCQMSTDLGESSRTVCIPSLRHNLLNARKVVIKEKFKKICFEDIGEITIPKMEIEVFDSESAREIEVNMEIVKSFKYNAMTFNLFFAIYKDLSRPAVILINDPKLYNFTAYSLINKDYINYHDNPPITQSSHLDMPVIYNFIY